MDEIKAVDGTSSSPVTLAPQPPLIRAAHEFEAQMMKELMKPLNSGSDPMGRDCDGEDDSSGSALGEFASESLGRALSDGGGLGLASTIVKQLVPSGNQNGTIPVTGIPHFNTGMNSHQ